MTLRPSLMHSKKVVTMAKAGVQCFSSPLIFLDAGFRRHDDTSAFSTFYESVFIDELFSARHSLHGAAFD